MKTFTKNEFFIEVDELAKELLENQESIGWTYPHESQENYFHLLKGLLVHIMYNSVHPINLELKEFGEDYRYAIFFFSPTLLKWIGIDCTGLHETDNWETTKEHLFAWYLQACELEAKLSKGN